MSRQLMGFMLRTITNWCCGAGAGEGALRNAVDSGESWFAAKKLRTGTERGEDALMRSDLN